MAAIGSMQDSKAQRRQTFVVDSAPRIAAQVSDIDGPWATSMLLSKRFGWFHGSDALVVVACPDELQRDVDLGLAYGLAHAADRELILVVPEGTAEPTRRRLPWIDSAVRLHTYNSHGVTPTWVMTRGEVLDSCTDIVVTAVHQLRECSTWVERLIAWAATCPELVAAHRGSYMAWHCRGRMALKIRKIRGGLIVSAGVHSTVPGHQPHIETLADALSVEQFHRLVAAASTAIADRLGGIDVANAEHELQERLAAECSQLGLRETLREFPAMRPVAHRGYIDLLGVGHHDTLHVVETKIGADEMLVLQGLDYWVWTTAHLTALVPYLNKLLGSDLPALPQVQLDFVVADHDGTLLSPYTAAQLEALNGSVPWQVHRIDGWDESNATVESFGRRRVPDGSPRVCEPAFPVRAEGDFVIRAGGPLKRRVFFTEPGGGILDAAKPAYLALHGRDALHRFVDHVKSSQAFALNLFGGLADDEVSAVWHLFGVDATHLDDVEFEYVDPQDALRESQTSRPHQTQVDVLLRARSADGGRHVALIEVKLTENGFGSCSAFDADENDRRDVCAQAGPWGGDSDGCFQLRNRNGPHRRTYDAHLDASWIDTAGVGCPFRPLNQPMRNIALARAMIDRGDADTATFALCAPTANTAVWRQWRQARKVFARVPDVSLHELPAETLLGVLSDTRRVALSGRYGLAAVSN